MRIADCGTEVVVDDAIAQPCDLLPRNIRVFTLKVGWHPTHDFTNDLQIAGDGVDGFSSAKNCSRWSPVV